jgi:hypothetical protein
MLSTALRFLLLRFLPGRLMPLLTAIEVIRLVRRLRARRPDPVPPRRIVTSTPPVRPDPGARAVRPRRSP